MKTVSTEPEDQIWKVLELNKEKWQSIYTDGIEQYKKNSNAALCKNKAFELKFAGLNCIAINGGLGSKIFDSLWQTGKYDMMISFSTDGKKWTVSLYHSDRPNIDCSVIAKRYGGGGHKGAAGFTCTKLPFRIITPWYQRMIKILKCK